MRLLAAETVTRVRGVASSDAYGNETIDWSNPDRLPIAGCSVQPEQGSEETFDRSMVVARWRLWGPSMMDLSARDRVEHEGLVYEVDGEVLRWPGRLAHATCLLKRVEG